MISFNDFLVEQEEIVPGEEQPYPHIALVGAYHHEKKRLPAILSSTRPWFKYRILAFQGPEPEDLKIIDEQLGAFDIPIIQPVLGMAEGSIAAILDHARAIPEIEWVFFLDGDELVEPLLLANLGTAVANPVAQSSKGVRIIKRSDFVLDDGTVLPGLTELNLRLYHKSCTRPAQIHSWVEGIVGDPLVWPIGAVREVRSLREYLTDQLRYVSMDASRAHITSELISKTYRHLSSYIGRTKTRELFEAISPDVMGHVSNL